MRFAVVLVAVRPALALVPLASVASTAAWLRESSFGVLDSSAGTLRPRLRSLDDDPLTLGLMESGDVGCVARLFADCFAPSVSVAYGGGFEDGALAAVAGAAKAYDVAEYAFGLRSRCGGRLSNPASAFEDGADGGAVVLAVCRRSGAECVGAVEIRLRPADGAHPAPLPVAERLAGLFSPGPAAPPRPYMSNVCVADRCRRRGLAKVLVSAAEHVAAGLWSYDAAFLHVHEGNGPALALYGACGYAPLDDLYRPPLRFFYKRLADGAPSPAEVVAAAGGEAR